MKKDHKKQSLPVQLCSSEVLKAVLCCPKAGRSRRAGGAPTPWSPQRGAGKLLQEPGEPCSLSVFRRIVKEQRRRWLLPWSVGDLHVRALSGSDPPGEITGVRSGKDIVKRLLFSFLLESEIPGGHFAFLLQAVSCENTFSSPSGRTASPGGTGLGSPDPCLCADTLG